MSSLKQNLLALFFLLIGLTLLGMINVLFQNVLLNPQMIFAVTGGILVLVLLLLPNHRQNILVIGILGLFIGWHGISFSPSFTLYLPELFIWIGFGMYLFEQTRPGALHSGSISIYAVILGILTLLGGLTAFLNGHGVVPTLNELKSFLIFIPMLILFRSWIQTEQQVLFYTKVLVYVGMAISVLGLTEKRIPFLSSLIPVVASQNYVRLNFGFQSSVILDAFSSWGTPVVSVLLVLLIGLSLSLSSGHKASHRLIWMISLPILGLGIVSSGYRSAWLGLLVVFALALLIDLKAFLYSSFIFLVGCILLFSSSYIDRFKTIWQFNTSPDPTFITRSLAMQNALHTILSNPLLGTGWASPTAFNDWVNIGVSMGIPGILFFAFWYGVLLWKLLNVARKSVESQRRLLFLGFFAALSGYAVSMVSGAMSQVFPIMTGFWFVFCLAWRAIEIIHTEEKNGKAVDIVANV